MPSDLGPRSLSFLRTDYDFDAAIELLFLDGPIPGDKQMGLTVSLGLNAIRIDVHIFYKPGFYGLSSPLAQVKVVLIAAKRVGMPLDLENGLRVSLNEPAQFLEAGGSSWPEIRRIVVKQQVCWHDDGGGSAPEFSRTGQQFIQVAETGWYAPTGGDI